jgi:hypothetical protein
MKLKKFRSYFTGKIREFNVVAEGISEMGNKMILVKERNQVTGRDMFVIYRWHPPSKSMSYITLIDSVMSSIPKGKSLEEFALESFKKMAKDVKVI